MSKKKVSPGAVSVLPPMEYKGCPIVIEWIGTIFMYHFCYENKLYGTHITVKPMKKELTAGEVMHSAIYMYDMAMATIDTLRGEDINEEEHGAAAQAFVAAVTGGENADKLPE